MESLWNHLAQTSKPIFMYGTGNGGDKIIAALNRYHVTLTGVFASDGFVRSRTFHNFPVRSYSDVIREYGNDIIVLLAFGTTIDTVITFIEELDKKHELIIPDVPLYGGDLFDGSYFDLHSDVLSSAEALFADAHSKDLFLDAIKFRLTGKRQHLLRTESAEDTLKYFFADRLCNTILDGGAFKGDSTSLFASSLSVKRIIAAEADPKTFKKLEAYAMKETQAEIVPLHAALWDTDGELPYISSGSRGSANEGQNHRAKNAFVPCRTIDSIFAEESVDLIKLDIEGVEECALRAAEKTILRDQPDMMVSLYHRTDDLFSIPLWIHEKLPAHKLYLRRIPCIPMWDLMLYAVK